MPEDGANAELATGFYLHHGVDTRRMQVLPEAGGWCAVLDRFKKDYVAAMRKSEHSQMVLLLDFDNDESRLETVLASIPDDLRDRVFVLGVWSEPEDLRKKLGQNLEEIGKELANDCPDGTGKAWSDELLRHNAAELARVRARVAPFLFR